MQTTETVNPWSYKGFTVDERRRRIEARRQRVLELIHRKFTVKEIVAEIGLSEAPTRKDIRALIDSGLIAPNEVAKPKRKTRAWRPTPETVILVAEMLRNIRTYADIANVVGVNSQTLSRWAKESRDPKIVKALKDRAKAKKSKPPAPEMTKADIEEARGLAMFGMTLNQKSDENRAWMIANGYDLKPIRKDAARRRR